MKKNNLTLLEKKSFAGWVPRKPLQKFLDIKNTAMSEFPQKYGVRTTRIGNRVYYSLSDIQRLLDQNVTDQL